MTGCLKVIKAAQRLIKNADSIRQSVDLSDAGIAIDSDYQAWESGFVSIPYDYRIADLRPNLKKLIGQGKAKVHKHGRSGGAGAPKKHMPTTGCLRPLPRSRRRVRPITHGRVPCTMSPMRIAFRAFV